MAYKRMRPGAYIGGRRYVRRRVKRRAVPSRRVTRSRTRVVSRPARNLYNFTRWIRFFTVYNATAKGLGIQTSGACVYTPLTSAITPVGTGSAAQEWNTAICFGFSDVPAFNEFSNLFDQYMINMVRIQIKMANNPDVATYPGANTNNFGNYYPTLWWCSDYDDNELISLAAIKEKSRVKHAVIRPNKELNIYVRPRLITPVYNTATNFGYSHTMAKTWVDMASIDIPHYGLKMVFDFEGVPAAVAGSFHFKINAQYYMSFKNPR